MRKLQPDGEMDVERTDRVRNGEKEREWGRDIKNKRDKKELSSEQALECEGHGWVWRGEGSKCETENYELRCQRGQGKNYRRS